MSWALGFDRKWDRTSRPDSSLSDWRIYIIHRNAHEAFLHYWLIIFTAYSKQLKSYGPHNLSSSTLFFDSVQICKLFRQLLRCLSSFTMHFLSSAKVSFSFSFSLKLNTTKHTHEFLDPLHPFPKNNNIGLKITKSIFRNYSIQNENVLNSKYFKSTLSILNQLQETCIQ